MRLLHPFRVLVEHRIMIVNAVYPVFLEQGRINVAVKILVRELRRFCSQLLAYVYAE